MWLTPCHANHNVTYTEVDEPHMVYDVADINHNANGTLQAQRWTFSVPLWLVNHTEATLFFTDSLLHQLTEVWPCVVVCVCLLDGVVSPCVVCVSWRVVCLGSLRRPSRALPACAFAV